MRAEFLLGFPTFEKDLHELKIVKTGVKKTRKPKVNQIASRKSSRFGVNIETEPRIGDETGSIEAVNHEIEVGEPGQSLIEEILSGDVEAEDLDSGDKTVHADDHEAGDQTAHVEAEDLETGDRRGCTCCRL
jgi:hypothetical protein